MRVKRCRECGAELESGPERCPLCGAEGGPQAAAIAAFAQGDGDVDSYQQRLRALKEQLRRLRDDAKAV